MPPAPPHGRPPGHSVRLLITLLTTLANASKWVVPPTNRPVSPPRVRARASARRCRRLMRCRLATPRHPPHAAACCLAAASAADAPRKVASEKAPEQYAPDRVLVRFKATAAGAAAARAQAAAPLPGLRLAGVVRAPRTAAGAARTSAAAPGAAAAAAADAASSVMMFDILDGASVSAKVAELRAHPGARARPRAAGLLQGGQLGTQGAAGWLARGHLHGVLQLAAPRAALARTPAPPLARPAALPCRPPTAPLAPAACARRAPAACARRAPPAGCTSHATPRRPPYLAPQTWRWPSPTSSAACRPPPTTLSSPPLDPTRACGSWRPSTRPLLGMW